jgi:hypothetical protein
MQRQTLHTTAGGPRLRHGNDGSVVYTAAASRSIPRHPTTPARGTNNTNPVLTDIRDAKSQIAQFPDKIAAFSPPAGDFPSPPPEQHAAFPVPPSASGITPRVCTGITTLVHRNQNTAKTICNRRHTIPAL